MQTPKEVEPHTIPVTCPEPVSPYVLSKEVLELSQTLVKTMDIGIDHFKHLQPPMGSDLDGVVQYISDVLFLGDTIVAQFTNISRNYYMILRYLEEREKMYKEAAEYKDSDVKMKKRKLDVSSSWKDDEDYSSNMEETD